MAEKDNIELVFTAIAEDRPGLVEALAEVVAAQDGNWIDSSMSRLGGEFAGIVRISVARERGEAVQDALKGLSADGIAVTVRRDVQPAVKSGHHVALKLTGQDHPGIVLEITRALAQADVNVDELETKVFKGSMTGEPMFAAHADIVLPDGLSLDHLRDRLEDIAHDLMVDINLKDVEKK